MKNYKVGDDYDEHGNRQCEFSLMSKGLGKSYLSEAMVKWHRNDVLNRCYCNLVDGKKISMPRYYRMKIYEWWDRNMIAEECVKRVDKKTVKIWNKPNWDRNIKESQKRDFRVMEMGSKKIVL